MTLQSLFVATRTYERLQRRGRIVPPITVDGPITATAFTYCMKLEGYVLSCPAEERSALDILVEECDLLAVDRAVQETLVHPFYGFPCAVETNTDHYPDVSTKYTRILGRLSDYYMDFGCLVGADILLWFGEGVVRIPDIVKPYYFTFVFGVSPPGETTYQDLSRCFDIRLSDDDALIRCPGPTRGYGVVLYDTAKEAVAQIVGTTIYIFPPVVESFANADDTLLKCIMTAVWEAYTRPSEPDTTEPRSIEDTVASWIDVSRTHAQRELHAVDQAIHELEEKLRMLYLSRRFTLQQMRHTNADKAEMMQTVVGVDRKLTEHLHLSSVRVIDGGIQAETHPLLCEHTDGLHAIGRFCIRLSIRGRVSVWSIDTPHPNRIAHPHLGKNGTPCFGNMSVSIQEAAMMWDVALVMDLVIRWLTEGYDPSLADTPIEEWPRVEKPA